MRKFFLLRGREFARSPQFRLIAEVPFQVADGNPELGG